MTIDEFLKNTGIDRADAELLMAFVLEKPRSWVIAHGSDEMNPIRLPTVQAMISRREKNEPLSYITGTKEFYGREFLVTKDTLIPRPATEAVVECTLQFLRDETPVTHEVDSGISVFVKRLTNTQPKAVIDVGTGSGCIAITLALEGIPLPIIAVDTSDTALRVAMKNARKFGVDKLQLSRVDGVNIVRNFHQPFLLVSNPPYIPSGTALDATVKDFEPHAALFAGRDGLDVIRPLVMAAKNNANCCGVILEMGTEQVGMIAT